MPDSNTTSTPRNTLKKKPTVILIFPLPKDNWFRTSALSIDFSLRSQEPKHEYGSEGGKQKKHLKTPVQRHMIIANWVLETIELPYSLFWNLLLINQLLPCTSLSQSSPTSRQWGGPVDRNQGLHGASATAETDYPPEFKVKTDQGLSDPLHLTAEYFQSCCFRVWIAQRRVTDPHWSSRACENILHSAVMGTVRQPWQGLGGGSSSLSPLLQAKRPFQESQLFSSTQAMYFTLYQNVYF